MKADRCECRGQCEQHDGRCKELFGQRKLFESGALRRKVVQGRELCTTCALSYDRNRRARQRRAERALSERQRAYEPYIRSSLDPGRTPAGDHGRAG